MPNGKEIFANKSSNGLDNVNADYVDVLHDLTVHGNTVLSGTSITGPITATTINVVNLTATDAEVTHNLTTDGDQLIKGNLTVWGSTTDTGAVNVTDSINGYLNGEQVHNTNPGNAAAAAFKAYNDTNDQAFFGITSSGNTGVHGTKRTFLEGPGIDISTTGGSSKTVRITTNDVNRVEVGDTEITSHVPITIPADPTTNTQVANKNYVDAAVAGLGAISSLTGDVTATGPGAAAATLQKIQGTTVTLTTPSTDQILTYNGTAFINQSTNGSGNVVRTTSAILTTPNLGTPSAVVLTNASGTAPSLTAGNVTNSSVDFAGTPFTTGGVVTASDSNTITSTNAGTAGQILVSNGAGVAPTFQFAGAALPDFGNFSTDTAVTFTVSPANATSGANYQATTTFSFYLSTAPGTTPLSGAVYASQDTYTFVSSSSHTVVIGSVYSNNGNQFIAAASATSTSLLFYGLGNAPPLSSGTLTLVTGSGSTTIPFTSQSITTPGYNFVIDTYAFTTSILYAKGVQDPLSINGILNKITGVGSQTIPYEGFSRPDLFHFTVSSTITGVTTLSTVGSGVPLDSGNLVKLTGTGDDVITYSARTVVALQLTSSSPTTIYCTVTKQFNLPNATTLSPGRSFIFAGAFNIVIGNLATVSIYNFGDTTYLVPLYEFPNTNDALFRATLLDNTSSTGKWAFTYEASASRGPVAYESDLNAVEIASNAAKTVQDIYNALNDSTTSSLAATTATLTADVLTLNSQMNSALLSTQALVKWDGTKMTSLVGTEDHSLLRYNSTGAPQYGGKAVITDDTDTDVILGVSNNHTTTCDGIVVKAPALVAGNSISSYFGTGISPGNCLELYYEHHGNAVAGNLARLNMGSTSLTIGSANFALESTDPSSATLNVVNDAIDATVFTSGEFATGTTSGGSALKQFGKDGLVGNNVLKVFNWNGNNSTSNFYRVILDNGAKFQLNNTTAPTTESVGQHTITATGSSSLTVLNSTTTGVSLGDFFAPSVADGFTYASFLRVGKNSTTGNNGTLSYVHTANASTSNYTQLAHNLSKINLFNTAIPSIEMIGSTTIAQADAATDSLIVYNNSSGTTIENAVFMNPNLPGGVANIRIGKSATTNNHGKIIYTHGGDGSSANSLSTEMGSSRIEQFASGANTVTGSTTINNATGSVDSLIVTNQETTSIDVEMASFMAPNINAGHVSTIRFGKNVVANNYVSQGFQYAGSGSASNAYYNLIGSSEYLLEASGVHTASGTAFNDFNGGLATGASVNHTVGANAGPLNSANYGFVYQNGSGTGENHALLGVNGYEALRLLPKTGVAYTGAQLTGQLNTPAVFAQDPVPSTSKVTGGLVVKGKYVFTLPSAATVILGDVYTNNGQYFTILNNSAGTTVNTSGLNVPTNSGVLTKVFGVGAATVTFSSYSESENGLGVEGQVTSNSIYVKNTDGGGAPVVAKLFGEAIATTESAIVKIGKGTSGLNDDYAQLRYYVDTVTNSILYIENGNSALGVGRTSGAFASSIPSSGTTAFTVNNSIATAENLHVFDTFTPSLQTGFNSIRQYGKNTSTGNKVSEDFFYNGNNNVGNYYRIYMDNGAELYLNNTTIPQVASLGQFSITNGSQTTPTLKAHNVSSSAGDIEVAEFMADNVNNGNFVNFKFGKNTSTGNHGDIEFFSNGNNDAANRFTFGLGSAGLAVNNAGENALSGKTTVTASGTSALIVNNNATGVVDVGEFYQPNMVASNAASIIVGKNNTSGNNAQLSFTYNADSTNHAALTCGSGDFTISSGGLSVLTASTLSTTAVINQVTANLGTGTHTLASFFNAGSVPVTNKMQIGYNTTTNACVELAHYADNVSAANDYATLGIVGLTPAIQINPTTLKFQQPVDFPNSSYTANGVAYASTTTRLASTGAGTAGQVLTSNGSGSPPTFQTVTGTGTVTSVSASVPSYLSVNVTNPTTTPAIAITATTTPTGTGTTVVLAGGTPTFTGTPNIAAATGTSLTTTGDLTSNTKVATSSTATTTTTVASFLAPSINGGNDIKMILGRDSTTNSWTEFIHHAGTITTANNYATIGLTGDPVAIRIKPDGSMPIRNVFTSSGTYVTPTIHPPKYIVVTLVGGGAGGHGATAGAIAGSGGGGGGWAQQVITSPSGSYTYTVGAGGSGGISTTTAPTSGGDSSFSGTTYKALGGAVGSYYIGGAGGGTQVGASIGGGGGCGGAPQALVGSLNTLSGRGGSSYFGGDTLGVSSSGDNNGNAGVSVGCGGSGSAANNISSNGGTGANGVVIVDEYYI